MSKDCAIKIYGTGGMLECLGRNGYFKPAAVEAWAYGRNGKGAKTGVVEVYGRRRGKNAPVVLRFGDSESAREFAGAVIEVAARLERMEGKGG